MIPSPWPCPHMCLSNQAKVGWGEVISDRLRNHKVFWGLEASPGFVLIDVRITSRSRAAFLAGMERSHFAECLRFTNSPRALQNSSLFSLEIVMDFLIFVSFWHVWIRFFATLWPYVEIICVGFTGTVTSPTAPPWSTFVCKLPFIVLVLCYAPCLCNMSKHEYDMLYCILCMSFTCIVAIFTAATWALLLISQQESKAAVLMDEVESRRMLLQLLEAKLPLQWLSAAYHPMQSSWATQLHGVGFGIDILWCGQRKRDVPVSSIYIYIYLYFLIYIIYIYFNRRKFALVEGLGHDLVCAGSIYHVHFAWQVWHGQYSPSFRWKGFAGRRLNKHNFEASVFYIYNYIYAHPPQEPPAPLTYWYVYIYCFEAINIYLYV